VPRIRTLKPEFWSDEKLSLLDPLTRLVFLGLISMADDYGRLVDNVKLLDGQLFPNTDDSCRAPLELLARIGRIVRYRAASGQSVIQVMHWTRHQKVMHPGKAVLPPVDGAVLIQPTPPEALPPSHPSPGGEAQAGTEQVSCDSHATLMQPSSPIPSDLVTNDLVTNDQRPTHTARRTPRERVTGPVLLAFGEAWTVYPRRSGANSRRDAEGAFLARVREGVAAAELIDGAKRYRSHCDREGATGTKFVMQASRFFGPSKFYAEPWGPALAIDPLEARAAALLEQDAEREAADAAWLESRRIG